MEMQNYQDISHDAVLGMLPNPFVFADGTRVRDSSDWRRRREEILRDTIALEYGGMPPKPEEFRIERTYAEAGAAYYRVFAGPKGNPFSFTFIIYSPSRELYPDKRPVIIDGDGCFMRATSDEIIKSVTDRGIYFVKFNRTDFAPDNYRLERNQGLYLTYPENTSFSAISAWAWGYHRVIDALELFPTIDYQYDKPDLDCIVVTGHSRGGKTALLAGVTDERVKIVNPNNSGAHGCGCYRYETHTPEYGEDSDESGKGRNEKMEDLLEGCPNWMGQGLNAYKGRIAELPHDLHFVKALAAPRYFLETDAFGDIWSNPHGSWQSFMAAREVWKFLGCEDRMMMYFREGGHRQGLEDFKVLCDLILCVYNGEKIPDDYYRGYFPDMKPIYDFSK